MHSCFLVLKRLLSSTVLVTIGKFFGHKMILFGVYLLQRVGVGQKGVWFIVKNISGLRRVFEESGLELFVGYFLYEYLLISSVIRQYFVNEGCWVREGLLGWWLCVIFGNVPAERQSSSVCGLFHNGNL